MPKIANSNSNHISYATKSTNSNSNEYFSITNKKKQKSASNNNNNNNSSTNTSSSRNRNSSEVSSTSTSSSSGIQLYDVEHAMLANNMENNNSSIDKLATSASTDRNYAEFADLTEDPDTQPAENRDDDEADDQFDEACQLKPLVSSSVMKRTHLKNLIHELYDLSPPHLASAQEEASLESTGNEESRVTYSILAQGFMEKLPPGKNLKNSILLAWRKRYFRLSSLGILSVYDNAVGEAKIVDEEPVEVYNLMGGRVEYEPNRVISLDDARGNFLVCRCCPTTNESGLVNCKKLISRNFISFAVCITQADSMS